MNGQAADMIDTTPLMTLVIELGELTALGAGPAGEPRLARIAGGRFDGPGLSGTVLPGSNDWQLMRPDGTLEINARYVLAVDSGGTVQVFNQGLRHGPADVLAALARGEAVDPASYFFRTVMRFATQEAPLDHLNRCIACARAERRGAQVVFHVHALN
jgi:hypothetical protein